MFHILIYANSKPTTTTYHECAIQIANILKIPQGRGQNIEKWKRGVQSSNTYEAEEYVMYKARRTEFFKEPEYVRWLFQ